jgi:uncharacterized membrane protein YfcA
MHDVLVILLGLGAGILMGLMGIGGGTVVVPALVYLLGMDQHVAQGTSLFMLLLPLGLGALAFLIGGYFGGRIAVGISSRLLQACFGFFLMVSAALLWRQATQAAQKQKQVQGEHV